jgi:SAM-dependent methyltransferase
MNMKLHRGNFESNLLFLKKSGLLDTPKRILEIGSGRGALVSKLREMGHDAMGTEVNPEYMAYAKDEYGVELVTISTATTALPFEDKDFDLVVSFDVFEHIPKTKEHVAEVKRVLKSGGSYLVCTPNKWTNIPFEILKEKSLTKYKEYHCALHNYWQIQERFHKAGFTTRFIEVPLVTPYFVEKIRKYLGAPGVLLVKVLRPDSWPQWIKTNFYLVATKND